MRFRTETRTRTVRRTLDGITNEVPEEYTVRVPRPPADWDAIATRAAVGLVLALTAVAVVWSTVSIGELLGGGVGFAAAVLFDLAWAVALLLEYLARFDPAKRTFAKRLGWALLSITMGAILWHGLKAGDVALAVIGAAVSLVAKVLWWGVMRFIDRDLSAADRAWVAAEISKANAKLAVAGVRRQAARSEARAAAELLAAEHTRAEFSELLAAAAPAPEPEALPSRDEALERAVSALRQASELAAADPAGEGQDRAALLVEEALDTARAAGVSAREVYDTDRARRALATMAAARAETSGDRPDAAPVPRPDAPGDRPDVRTDREMVQVGASGSRPDAGAGTPGRPPSIAAGVRQLVAAGITDPDVIGDRLSAVMGRPMNPETIAREVRDATKTTGRPAATGRGGYL